MCGVQEREMIRNRKTVDVFGQKGGVRGREVDKEGRGGQREGGVTNSCFTAVFHLLARLCLCLCICLSASLCTGLLSQRSRSLYQTVSHTVYLHGWDSSVC